LIAGNKRGRVDEHEHKEEGQSGVTPSSESISANPIQEQANLVELQTNPEEVEDNAGTSLSSDSAYIEQCDLINHIPQVSEYDLVFFLANTRQNNGNVF
jgi:hypothetical protein